MLVASPRPYDPFTGVWKEYLEEVPAHSSGGTSVMQRTLKEIKLRVQADTSPGETVFIAGSIKELGEWFVNGALPMVLEDANSRIWSASIGVAPETVVEYRYLICVALENGARIVRRWETILHPRRTRACELTLDKQSAAAACDVFGSYDGREQMEPGWLTAETMVQFKFFNNPVVLWKKKYKLSPISVRVTPINVQRRASDLTGAVSVAAMSAASLASMGDESEQQSNFSDLEPPKWPIIEYAVMREGEYDFKRQPQFGHVMRPDDFVVFQTQVLDPTTIAYMVDFYIHPADSIPEHIGFAYIIPANLKGSCGVFNVPIAGPRQQPVGQLSVDYLIARPLQNYTCTAQHTFAKFWKKVDRGLDVGHRGAGNARRTDKVENVLENTVASFNYAAKHGADMVELDVQLSKDLVPVVYHDYHICISMKKRRVQQQEDELLQVAVKDLTAVQLQRLKLSPVTGHSESKIEFQDDDAEDNQPFPTLQHILQAVDQSVGFNVELKCPMQLRDGTWELDQSFDMNQFVDIILKTLLEHSGNRFILLSCFHPDICTLIRLKQNKYPLLFLTQGQTEKYPPYLDPRTASGMMATFFASSIHILGINCHTEELLRNPSMIQFVKEHKLILFCWGEDNNHSDMIAGLKKQGVDGVIYDKLDLFISGEREHVYLLLPNASVSLMEAAQSCSRECNDPKSMLCFRHGEGHLKHRSTADVNTFVGSVYSSDNINNVANGAVDPSCIA